ncbi:MAG: hypothetical protein A3D28_01325 [Omnitrophica bacterium RIFCSPHIGHO2_02_FULL_63_14]|nr:MAG: hypothetical protein A3D28_01325 [Omnitrophica bacterium RIFCSPHIGHO2_02_FULL_63_14]
MLTPEEVKRHTAVYIRVFAVLAILTMLTVGVSYLRLPVVIAIVVALAIATLKASLVASFFMHLAHEKKVIFWVLGLAFFLFLALLFVIAHLRA